MNKYALAVAALITGVAHSAWSITDVTTVRETPQQADTFVDSVGVDTHFYLNSPYETNWNKLEPLLVDSGVRHIRDGGWGQSDTYYDRLKTLGQAGIHSSSGTKHTFTNEQVISLAQSMPYMEDLEPDNEYDGSKDTNWVSVLQVWQKHLYTLVKSTPSLSKLAVLGPPLENTVNAPKLGNLSAYMDFGNVHNQQICGLNPGAQEHYATAINEEQADSDTRPIWVTESGYNDDPTRGCHVPSDIVAKYLPRDFLEWNLAGAVRVYWYQFSNMLASDPIFGGKGLILDNGTPKPQYYALKSMLSLLTDKGASFSPKAISLTFGGDMTNIHHKTFEKRDGSYWIAIWIETLSYDYNQKTHGGTDINVRPQTITIKPGLAISAATAYTYDTSDWSLKASAVRIVDNTVSLDATDTVTFLKLK